MPHLWSGRFDALPDDEVFEFQASFRFDRQLFEDDVTGSLAWAEALAGAGVLSRGEATAIRTALEEILDRGRADPGFVEGPDEDIHAFVERQLIERVGDAGRRLHTGRSRNEQVSLDLRLYLRRRTAGLQREIVALVAGGGIGNWLDRLLNQGTVTDFVSLGVGPLRTGIFNLADVAVMAGVALLLLSFRRKPAHE